MNIEIKWFDELDSTNSSLRRDAEAGGALPGTVYAARRQTAGRGRLDRRWQTSAGEDLACSFFLAPNVEPAQQVSLAMCGALSVQELLSSYGVDCRVKWPNDVLVPAKNNNPAAKICGILSESFRLPESAGFPVCVLGIGINLNMEPEAARTIDRPATSIYMETNQKFSPDSVLEDLVGRFPHWYEKWLQDGFCGIAAEWLERSGGTGQELTVHNGPEKVTGILAGYGELGELYLQTTDQGRITVWSGDVTI